MSRVFDPGRSGVPARQMTSTYQLEAFRHRAYLDGDWSTWQQINATERTAAADRAARRRARLDTIRALPPQLLTGAGVLAAVAAVAGVWWLLVHPLALAVAGGITGSAATMGLWGWARSRRVVRPVPVAPPAMLAGHAPASTSLLDVPLTGLARALVDGLPAARRRLYLDALTRGLIGAPDETRTPSGRLIRAQLPGGQITPADIDTDRMAQTLGLHADQVRRDPDAPAGLLVVEVLDVRPRDLDPGPWPHQGARCDLTAPVTLGVDDRGEPVGVTLAGRRLLVVGQSGSGKTRLMRALGLFALADPRVQLDAVDLKGSPATRGLRQAAAWSHVGAPDDRLRDRLQALHDEMRARYAAFERGEDPITSRGWRVLWIDEVQALWSAPWALPLMTDLALQGREAGIGLIMGCQIAKADHLPTAVLAQCDLRVLLRAPESWLQQMVLSQQVPGGGLMPPGHGHLWDNGDTRRIATHHVDDDHADAHLATVHRPALPAGLHLVTSTPGTDEHTSDDGDRELLCRVRDAIGDRGGLPWADLARALDREPAGLRDHLRGLGVPSQTVWDGTGSSPRGVRRGTVLEALTR